MKKIIQPLAPPQNYSIEELKSRLKMLESKGFLPIFGRNRNSAIGESLEVYLGLKLNSSRSADWGIYELKTTSMGSNRKISLFNVKWQFQNDYTALNLVKQYGKIHHSKHLDLPVIRLDWDIMHSTTPIDELYINFPANDGPLTLNYAERQIALALRVDVQKWFKNKFKNLVIIEVRKEKINEVDGFLIQNAFLYSDTCFENFITLIHTQEINMTFKLMLIQPETPNEKFNNRGSGFRTPQSVISKLYSDKVKLL